MIKTASIHNLIFALTRILITEIVQPQVLTVGFKDYSGTKYVVHRAGKQFPNNLRGDKHLCADTQVCEYSDIMSGRI